MLPRKILNFQYFAYIGENYCYTGICGELVFLGNEFRLTLSLGSVSLYASKAFDKSLV